MTWPPLMNSAGILAVWSARTFSFDTFWATTGDINSVVIQSPMGRLTPLFNMNRWQGTSRPRNGSCDPKDWEGICSCQTTKRAVVSARHHYVCRAIRGKLNSELASQGAFGFPQHLEASLPISRCIGCIHALHVLLFRGHTPLANGRSIGAIQIARRSWNYSFGYAYREYPSHAQAISTSLLA